MPGIPWFAALDLTVPPTSLASADEVIEWRADVAYWPTTDMAEHAYSITSSERACCFHIDGELEGGRLFDGQHGGIGATLDLANVARGLAPYNHEVQSVGQKGTCARPRCVSGHGRQPTLNAKESQPSEITQLF